MPSNTPKINLSLSLDEMTDFADKVRDMFGEEVDGDGEHKPAKQGVKAGLREGETRITCVFGEDENQVLHDWAKLTRRTFREVCIAMVRLYINSTISSAIAKTGVKLNVTSGRNVPKQYSNLYNDEDSDVFAKCFEE